MALSCDDRILGGKVDNYVSSSEDSQDEAKSSNIVAEMMTAGRTNQTGPKGVLQDYHEFRRQEKEQRIEQQANFYARLKLQSMTVKTDREEGEEKELFEEEWQKFEEQNKSGEDDDEFLKEYRMRRMKEMYRAQQAAMSRFGTFLTLSADNFVQEIDKESPQTVVVVHVYEPDIPACDAMNGCLIILAADHPSVKFCRVRASSVKMSNKFMKHGLPTLLIYQNKQLISNFVSLSRFLGNDFFAKDVETFLQEHGFLNEHEPSKILGSPSGLLSKSSISKNSTSKKSSDEEDSDD